MRVPDRAERIAYLLTVALLLAYVALRAAWVPFVHDESASVMWYAERGEFLPYHAHWDANNHMLSSACGALAFRLWGLSPLGLRMGSVLAFLLFAWAAWRIGRRLRHPVVRGSFLMALLACPFLLDFFSLFRGYGLEMAFLLVAVDGLLRWWDEGRDRDLVQALLGMGLANAAVLALVPLWALVVGGILLRALTRKGGDRRRAVRFILPLLGILPLAAAVRLAFTMKALGLLYHGSTEGLWTVTVLPLFRLVAGITVQPLVVAAVLLLCASSVLVLVRGSVAVRMLVLLFWGDLVLRAGMAILLGVNYPEDRAALHLVPLALLIVAFAADLIARTSPRTAFASLVLLALPVRTIATANTDHTLLWPEQSVPPRFLAQVEAVQRRMDRPVMLGAYHQLSLCIPLTARQHGIALNAPSVTGFPAAWDDVRIVDARFLAEALRGFHEVDQAPGPGLHLLVRDAPQQWSRLDAFGVADGPAGAEFRELYAVPDSLAGEDLLVEVQAVLVDSTEALASYLVVAAKQDDADLHYDAVPLALFRMERTGGGLHLLRPMPAVAAAERRVAYFWNARTPGTAFKDIEVILHHRTEQGN